MMPPCSHPVRTAESRPVPGSQEPRLVLRTLEETSTRTPWLARARNHPRTGRDSAVRTGWEHGGIIYARGSVVRLMPFCINREEVDQLVEIVAASIESPEPELSASTAQREAPWARWQRFRRWTPLA